MKRAFSTLILLSSLSVVPSAVAQNQASVQPDHANDRIYVISGKPTLPTPASPNNFTGDVTVKMLMTPQDALGLSSGYVNFSADARTNWHTHPEGQMLIVTSGAGRVQQWGQPIIEIKEGDVVWFPANVKHWHGAMPNQAMTHLSMAKIIEGKSSVWLERVTDEQYNPPS